MLADILLLGGRGLADSSLAELFYINLGEPASNGRPAQKHVLAILVNTQTLISGHFNELRLTACVKGFSF